MGASDLRYMKAVEYDKLPSKFKKQYPSLDALEQAGWWLQKKYDGCYGMVKGGQMLSRTGEDYTRSCGHIVQAVQHRFGAEAVVLGEVWKRETPFKDISGKFRTHAAQPDLIFMVHDMLPATLLTGMAYRQRFDHVLNAIPPNGEHTLFPVETYYPGQWSGAMSAAVAWKGLGWYDGAILRAPHEGYTFGTVKLGEIIKVKPVVSLDLRIVEFYVEAGEKTGRPVVTVDVEYQGKRTRVGSGIPHDIDTGTLIGAIAEIECMEVTEDGKLREPRFKGLRFDKEQPD